MKYLKLNNTRELGWDFDRFFGDLWTQPSLANQAALVTNWTPAADIEEEETHYRVTLDAPGLKREEIQIEVADQQLWITGERKALDPGKSTSLYSERNFGKFQRSFKLPVHVDSGKIEAQYLDGVLSLKIPKAESAKPRQIKIA